MSDKKIFLGIDPGKQGFLVAYNPDKQEHKFYTMPFHDVGTGEFKVKGGEKTESVFHQDGFRDLILQLAKEYSGFKLYGVIEDVTGRQQWSAQNNFAFGFVTGLQTMIYIMLKVEYLPIKPQKWQAMMYRGFDKVKVSSKSGMTMVHDTKATSAIVSKAIAPNIDFRRTTRSKNIDDNKTDAFLISEFCRLHAFKNV